MTRVLEDFHEEQDKIQQEENKTPDGNDDKKIKSNSPIPPRATPEDLTDDSSPPISMVAPRSKTPPESRWRNETKIFQFVSIFDW